MNFSKLQKIISSFLLFVFFFGQVFGLSLFGLFSNSAYAENTEFNDLISIIVPESIYNELDNKIERYAEDIQNYIDNIRVVILPIKENTTAFQIASMNEKLFYEGYKGLKSGVDFESRLVGTVLIGDIDLPILEDNGKTIKSIVPFVDFEDKQFIYNQKTKLFEKNRENIDGLKVEIFHGVISPNSGNKEENIKKISDFLDKDHDFYAGKNLFDKNNEILNGKTGEQINGNYKPYVFYFDQIREQKAINYSAYVGYEAYLKNKEDIIYNRFSQGLNKKIQDDIKKGNDLELKQSLEGIKNQDILDAFADTQPLDTTAAPDISLRYIINSSTKKFLEIFNKGTISDFRTNVHNAGRYNNGSSKVQVDMIPYMISILDNITDKSLKSANSDLEDYIFSKTEPIHTPIPVSIKAVEGLPKNISGGNSDGSIGLSGIPEKFFINSNSLGPNDIQFVGNTVNIPSLGISISKSVFGELLNMKGFYADADGNTEFQLNTGENVLLKVPALRKILSNYESKYDNFYYGRAAEYLGGENGGAGTPENCTIYRGNTSDGGQLTENNHGFDSREGESDGKLIDSLGSACESSDRKKITKGFWGGNSIINFNSVDGIKVKLNYQSPELSIEDLYDPLGSQQSFESSKNPSINNCYNYNYLLTNKPITTSVGDLYKTPIELNMSEKKKRIEPIKWTCESENINFLNTDQTSFGKVYVISTLEGMLCSEPGNCKGRSEVDYNGNDGVDTADQCLTNGIELIYGAMGGERTFYKASTYIDHKGNELLCPVTRYKYDFTSTEGYVKHHEPTNETLNNQIKNPGIPSLPIDRDRYLEVFTGDILKYKYPYLYRTKLLKNDENYLTIDNAKKSLDKFLDDYDAKYDNIFELKKFITSKKDQTVKIGNEDKTFNYYDFLAFSILWNNLDSVEAKYKFVMQYYLSDQIGGNDFKFVLPKNKKEYEIAYLGAEGDTQNMYIKMDPENNINKNPYLNILGHNKLLDSNKISVGVLNGTNRIDYNTGDLGNIAPVNYADGLFKCAPPEGVPIWEWIPAVMCWIGGLLPPKISIGGGECSASTIFGSDDEVDYYKLLSEQVSEQQEIETSAGGITDSNRNGLNDVCENKIKDNGKVQLTSDSSRYSFNSRGILRAEVLDKQDKRIMIDNSSNITFNLKKIIDKTSGEVIFDSSIKDFEQYKNIISKYIYFKELERKSRYGESTYSFSTKNKEADIYFEANLDLRNLNGESIKKIKSNTVIIKVRNNNLFLSSKVIGEDGKVNLGNTAKANAKTNVYLYNNSNNLNLDGLNKNSIALGIINLGDKNKNKNISFPLKITLRDSAKKVIRKELLNSLNGIRSLFKIKKSGSYKIEIEDKYGYKITSNFEILSGAPKNLKLTLGSNILESNGSVSTNLISIYDEFGNIVSGEKYNFKLNILGNSILFNDNQSSKLELSTYEGFKAFRIKSTTNNNISKIKIDLFNGEEKLFSASKNIKVLDTLNVEITKSEILKVGNNKYNIELEFRDKNNNIISDLNSRVYLNTVKEYITLDKPYYDIKNGKASIVLKTKTLASEDLALNFRVEGFSKQITKFVQILPGKAFGLSFVDTKTKLEADSKKTSYINLELRDIYNNVVFTDSDSIIKAELLDEYKKNINIDNLQKKLYKGKVNFKISGTELPGKAYLKFSINKKLEDNKFVIGEGENEIIVNGVSENAIEIKTYFFYNKKSIENRKYNALYTTLLGASYGDITQKDYLAGSMIFDKNNRSLAVTSLLSSPYNSLDSIHISGDGIIKKVYNSSDLTQDVRISLEKDINNKYYLNLFNTALNIYIGKIYLNFDNLEINESIYAKIENSKDLDIKKLFNLKKINIFTAKNKVKLNQLLDDKSNSLILYLAASNYKVKDLYLGEGNSKAIYYIDPFNTEFSLNSFSRYSLDTYDNFQKNKKLGWGAGNKTLLAFASGESVGNSTKQYMGVSGINLGDPIISLKKIRKTSYGIKKNFDSTIGKKLNNKEVQTYRVFDYNADNLDDILFIEDNGILSLLENTKTSKGFLNQKNLARISDFGNSELLGTGDFSGDNYDDIFFVNKKGDPYLLNNNKKDFVRYNLSENFGLKGRIIQSKIFDMDNDGVDDIVTLDNFGEINIFYGNKDKLEFTKKLVYSGYSMKLNPGIRNNMGAVYFDGLIQDIKSGSNGTESTKFRSVDILENLMFESIAYDKDVDPNKENFTKNTKFIKSEFASEVGIKVEKTYNDINGGNLQTGDIINVEVKLKNTTNNKINNIAYLENTPKYFDIIDLSIENNKGLEIKGGIGNYKFYIDKFSLNKGEELIIRYKVKTKSLAYGNIKVGLFEKDEIGDDDYGDIIVSTSKYNCGGNVEIFRSINKRSYEKGQKNQSCENEKLPEELAKNDIDEDGNGIPDYIDDLSIKDSENPTSQEVNTIADFSKASLDEYTDTQIVDIEENIYNGLDKFNSKVDELSSEIDNLIDGFGCGFGGGSCFSLPINWAPLAPGNDISTPFGLIGDGLRVSEGTPVFSTLTGLQTSDGCFPSVWPISPLAYVPGATCGLPSAGGYLGTWAPTNTFRFFITPTLTGGIGTAACFGGPASAAGQIPPQIVTPFIPGGNCVVAAAPLPNLCKDEEIEGNPASLGPVDYIGNGGTNGGDYGIINANCSAGSAGTKDLPISNKIDTSLAGAYLDYRNSGVQNSNLVGLIDKNFGDINNRNIDYGSSLLQNQPLISVGGVSAEEADITLNINSEDGFQFNAVDELRMKRVAPFPRFITQWVNDQLEEFITKLVDFPTFFIILPDFSKIFDTDWGKYVSDLASGAKKGYNTGGIKEAYEFLGNVPFVSIEGEVVNINIPEIDPEYYETIITQWSLVLQSYPNQIEEAINSGKYSPESIISAREFMKSLEINLSILRTYKDIPGALSKLFNKKQEYLEQVMCNIESIENITGGWLGFNGKRFKAWVELYILIKAILKSWQLLVDIFQDYDAACHECKNERWDSTQWEWTMISMIIPPIPVIKFPKWPDIVLDIHNIRLNLAVKLPDFKINYRPIILPPAPKLLLPDYDFIIPALPTLPLLQIPELPDIPSLPTIKLPDLPPPPTLPKLFANIEGFLNILKLIVKAMCILKKVPLVPEARVGDQIAFLTEGGGYRGFDFIDQLLPNFSYPYLDEIKVTSYVNLEFDTDFITEMARTIVAPVNNFTNDFTNLFDGKSIPNIDLSGYSRSAYSGEEVNSSEFLSLVNKELSKNSIIVNPVYDNLKKSFDVVNNYTYSKEDKLISDLQKANYEKFDLIKSILKTELKDTKLLKNKAKEILDNKNVYQKISNTKIDKIKVYNSSLSKYNNAFKKSAENLLKPSYFNTKELKESGNTILQQVKGTTDEFNNFVTNKYKNSFGSKVLTSSTLSDKQINDSRSIDSKNYLASVNATGNSNTNSCNSGKASKYSRKYEGIYVIQGKINYKLFDYLDDLLGDEVTTPIDYDLDGDKDLLYSVNGDVYLKENLFKKENNKKYFSGVEVLNSDENKFINGDIFYEAINGLTESYLADNYINVNFLASKRDDISNYRFEYYSIIDKYLNEKSSSYIPEKINKNIVDAFSGIEDSTIIDTGTGYTLRNNLSFISEVGNNIPKVSLKTNKLLNIKDSLIDGNVAIISGNTYLFTGNSRAKITYLLGDSDKLLKKTIEAHKNIQFDEKIKIISISGDLYSKSFEKIILKGNEIYNYLGLPLFPESKIEKFGNFNKTTSSHIGIKYYDNSELNLDFRKINSYEIYDLGAKFNNYSITLNIPNDYYYSRIGIFKNNILGTKTSQTLISPQKEADNIAPELDLNTRILVPVYQYKTIDITNNFYENSGIGNISQFEIEGIDKKEYSIIKNTNSIKIKFGKFDKIFTKKIKFIVSDKNGNTLKKDISLEVYPPIPQIKSYSGTLVSGVVNEELNNEPINLYRFRGGSIKRLQTNSGTTRVNTENGKFDFKLKTIRSNLVDININNSKVFNVDENTGKINLNNSLYNIKAKLNNDNYIEISVNDNNGEQIFSELIKLDNNKNEIVITDDFSSIENTGLYLRLISDDYDYFKIPNSAKFNAGAVMIYRKTDLKKEALFAILPDSRIKTLNGFYRIQYSTFDDYIKLELIDRHFNKKIGELLLKLDSAYVIK